MQLLSYKQAIADGVDRYFTGRPCKRGHIAERRVSGRCCIVCADNASKTWAKQNQTRVKQIAAEWNARNKVEEAERARKWRKNNPDTYKRMVKEWRDSNAAYYRRYMSQVAAKRRAAKLQREPSWADNDRIRAYYDVCAFFNDVNGYTKYHVDHIIPLQGTHVSGLHVHSNLQIILADANRAKGNTFEVL